MPMHPSWQPGDNPYKGCAIGVFTEDLPGFKGLSFKRMVDEFAIANPTFGRLDPASIGAINNAIKRWRE